MKRLVSPLLLVAFFSLLSAGWRSTPTPDSAPPDSLMNPVSMTLAGDRLLVSDAYTGLHVYDVSNLTAPIKVIRIPLRYNQSSAVKDDIIYTNSVDQLQAIRVTGDTYQVVARIGSEYRPIDDMPIDSTPGGYGCACTNTYDPALVPDGALGGGSSFATFAMVDDYLYRVMEGTMHVYDVTTAAKPKELSSVRIGWDVETLQPSQNLLFLGGFRGMYIYDRSDPRHPKAIGQIQHTTACDPVVVTGSTAFITLRQSGCGGAADELMCVSIKDPRTPRILGEKPLTTPYGLAVQNQQLYVSHGESGYSLMDVSQPTEPSVQATWVGSPTRDFIWSGNTLFVLSDHNVAIYDVSDPLTPRLLSKVEPDGTL